ncbi:MAG: thioredoxin family protein [Cyclobacteriaceae bacterium]
MEIVETANVIEKALQNSMSYAAYSDLLQEYAREGKTTGPTQNEDLIYYSKLNAQRSKRITKTVHLNPKLVDKIAKLDQKNDWLLITESWCGDAANSVPVIAKLAELSENIDLRIVMRDANTDLIDQFLTRGGRSIPKLIVLNSSNEVLFTWGPRPDEAQKLYDGWKNSEEKVPYKEFQVELQKWYNQDGGSSLQQELLDLYLG